MRIAITTILWAAAVAASPPSCHDETPQPLAKVLTQKVIDGYRRDGVVKVEDVFTPFKGEMRKLIDVLDTLPPFACRYQSTMFHLFVHKLANATNFGKQMDLICSDASTMFQEVEDMIFTSAIGSIAAQLLGTSSVRLDHAPLMRGDGTFPTPWHADNGGPYLTNGTGLVVWVPFEPSTPYTDGLKFIASSHKFPAHRNRPSFCNDKERAAFCVERLGRREEDKPSNKMLTYNLKVGDALFFDKGTMHASTGFNMTRRHNLQIRLIAAGDEHEDAYFKNIKGSSYGNPYGFHDDRADTFRFPQIYPNVLANEYTQRVAYKKRDGLIAKIKYVYDMLRVSIDSMVIKDGISSLCPEGKCFAYL